MPRRIKRKREISDDVSAFDATRKDFVNQSGVILIGADSVTGELRETRTGAEIDAVGRGVEEFGGRNVALVLHRRGFVRAHLGLNVIGDCDGRDDQNHGYDDQQFDEGEPRFRPVVALGSLCRFEPSHFLTLLCAFVV
jgi:hypothetical protein